MNKRNSRFANLAARTVAAATVFLMIPLFAAPLVAIQSSNAGPVEASIKDLHAKLKITAAQEDQWAKVAAAMRDNAKSMDVLTSARMANAKTMTAVEDINAYGVIAYAHADEIKKFAPVFAALYSRMSSAQKSEADELFGHGIHDTDHLLSL
jgi:hypothetical protein